MKNSCFGCADCYEVFDLLMRDSIKQLQGSDTHKGKHPKYGLKILPENITRGLPGAVTEPDAEESQESPENREALKKAENVRMKIRDLKVRMGEAVRNEKYEDAAKYRDMINALRKEGQSDA